MYCYASSKKWLHIWSFDVLLAAVVFARLSNRIANACVPHAYINFTRFIDRHGNFGTILCHPHLNCEWVDAAIWLPLHSCPYFLSELLTYYTFSFCSVVGNMMRDIWIPFGKYQPISIWHRKSYKNSISSKYSLYVHLGNSIHRHG